MPQPALINTTISTRDESDVSSLLSASSSTASTSTSTPAPAAPPKLANPTPRTPNRVRFALDDDTAEDAIEMREPIDWAREDYLHSDDEEDEGRGRGSTSDGHRPLLTDREAPTVTVANELEEHNRPKSGMRMAFMNMANSIIGAGIIGEQAVPLHLRL
jgi:sodium-coupled neutral amino acid transporter 11